MISTALCLRKRFAFCYLYFACMKHAKKISTAAPLENWRRPPGRPRTTWMKTIRQDLKSNNLSLNEAIDMAENHPLWRLMYTFGAMHS